MMIPNNIPSALWSQLGLSEVTNSTTIRFQQRGAPLTEQTIKYRWLVRKGRTAIAVGCHCPICFAKAWAALWLRDPIDQLWRWARLEYRIWQVDVAFVRLPRASVCAVPWCLCLVGDPEIREAYINGSTASAYCTVHQKDPKFKPHELEPEDNPDRLLNPDACQKCEASGECWQCKGRGEVEHECGECAESHEHECDECDGSGECVECEGTGSQSEGKKKRKAQQERWKRERAERDAKKASASV